MSALAFSRAVSILVCSLGTTVALVGDAASQGSPSRPLVSEAQYEAWQTELSKWGRRIAVVHARQIQTHDLRSGTP